MYLSDVLFSCLLTCVCVMQTYIKATLYRDLVISLFFVNFWRKCDAQQSTHENWPLTFFDPSIYWISKGCNECEILINELQDPRSLVDLFNYLWSNAEQHNVSIYVVKHCVWWLIVEPWNGVRKIKVVS